MKATTIVKVSPEIELTSPTLLQCRTGECGGCPSNTGKLLWILPVNAASINITLNFQYNFFDKSAESTSPIKFNSASGFNTLAGNNFSYEAPPNRAWAVANHVQSTSPSLSPSLMSGAFFQTCTFNISGAGAWLFFRQPNPAISNVHDALCFEYNHEKKLITFRSF